MFGSHRSGEKRVRGPFMRWTVKLLIFVIIFGAGSVSGMFYGIYLTFNKMQDHAKHMAELPDHVVPRLAEQFDLSDDQLTQFDTVFRKYHGQITEVETENAVQVHDLFYEMGKEIIPLLNEEQVAEFRETHRKICTVFLPVIPLEADEGVHHCPELWLKP